MKKKEKKKQKKKDKALKRSSGESKTSLKNLEKTVKRLEKEIQARDALIKALNRRIDGGSEIGKTKTGGEIRKKTGRTSVGVAQRKAWKQHSYLRDRYEHHLNAGRDKPRARLLANQDLSAEFGQKAGYTEQELLHILS